MIQYIIPTTLDKHPTNGIVNSINNLSKHDRYVHIQYSGDSIFQKYNLALEQLTINEHDVIVFVHNDIEIRDDSFEKKLEMYFAIKRKIGIAGVIGTNVFTEGSGWWLTDRQIHTRGRIIQGFNDGTEHPMIEAGGIDDSQIVSVDGCTLFLRGSIAKDFKFDECTYNGYHFYDCDSCFTLMEQGWHVGIIDICVQHGSEGPLSKSWHDNRIKFLKKWKDKGYTFPITKEQFSKHLNI
jgi:hypothetical protein